MLFRALFPTSPHLDILTPNLTGTGPFSQYDPPWTPFRWPTRRIPRRIANRLGLPAAQIPLPHPASFPSLLHWLYFGDFSRLAVFIAEGPSRNSNSNTSNSAISHKSPEAIEERWRGLVLNAEYLGLHVHLRTWLSEYWTERMDSPMPEFVEECEDPQEEERRRKVRSKTRAKFATTTVPPVPSSPSVSDDQELARRMLSF